MICDNGIKMKFVVLLLLGVFVCGDEGVRCIEREREALVSFKNGLTDEYGILSSWRSDECCNWYRVVCGNTTDDDGHVISLELGTRDLIGTLGGKVSSSLLELHHLNYLDLSYNDFGSDRIPEFIGSMKQLRHLYLSHSKFYGVVPPHIGNLTNLRSLDLSYNSLSSANLNWLSSLSLLSFLDLSSFDLSHTNWLQHILPLHSLRELHLESCNIDDADLFVNSSSKSLSSLDVSNNHLTPSAFDWLSNVSASLVKVDLSQNALGGLTPNALERLSHVEHLDLSSNMLECEIPKSLSNLSHLRVLVLYNNEFRGDLNQFIGNLSSKALSVSLEVLDLASNQFNGSLPDLTVFSSLTELYLDNNKFTGSMPHSLGQLSKLEVLDVAHNYLNGTVSETHLIKLANLKLLDLSFNSLILRTAPDWSPPFQLDHIFLAGCDVDHSFPKWIQTQRNYTTLDLSSSGIKGDIPKWLWSLSIGYLFLSDNQINGTLPDLSSTPIPHIDLRSNEISGPIPLFHPHTTGLLLSQNMFGSISSICSISHLDLRSLDLSNNQLSGEIPNCWEKMPNLISLNLANNSFSGELPHSLGSIRTLIMLQLRDNNLSGELPSTLRFCGNLQLIDVGSNHLSGYVPLWIGVRYRNMRFLIFQRNEFYGTVPPEICHLTRVQILDFSSNNLSGKIPDCFNNFTFLADSSPTSSILGYGFQYFYNSQLPNVVFDKVYDEYSYLQWKGKELEYRRNLILLKLY